MLATGITTTSYKISSQPIATSGLSVVTSLIANKVYKFKLKSRNVYGLSTTYSNEISVMAAHVPDAPLGVANNAAVTASGIVGLTWSAAVNGGSPIIDYRISYYPTGGAT